MKRITIHYIILSLVLYLLVLSCYGTTSHAEEPETDLTTALLTTEQYFDGNLRYHANGTYFEESSSGTIIPVEMTGLPYMIETEFPQIIKREGEPVHIVFYGYLAPQIDDDGLPKQVLTIKRIKDIYENHRHIQPLTGVYAGEGHTLTLSADHTYSLQHKNGTFNQGNWFLHAKSTMVLSSENTKTIMRVNYKKKSLNTRDDHPVIFTLASTPSSH